MKLPLLIRLFVLIIFSSIVRQGCAQQLSSYVYSYSAASAYSAISGTPLVTGYTFDDTVFTNIPLGFTFYFEGNPYTTIGVSSNGFIWFGNGTASKGEYYPISDASSNLGGSGTINGAVAPFAGNLLAYPTATLTAPSGGPMISYTTTGSSGSYVFTVQWEAMQNSDDPSPGTECVIPPSTFCFDGERVDMQIILYQSNNAITVIPYCSPFAYLGNANSYGQVGIRGASNTDFVNLSVDCSTYKWATPGHNLSNSALGQFYSCYPAAKARYTWTPPAVVSCPLKITGNTFTNPTCNNSTDGSITITALDTVTPTTLTYTINAGSNISNTTGNFTGLAGGTYTVSVSNGSCSISGKNDTLAGPAAVPSPTASNTGPYCTGGTLQLNATTVTNATYHWTGPNSFTSGHQDTSLANITVIDSGNYSVVATVGGCSSSPGTTHVVIAANLAPPVLSSNSPVCQGDTLKITATNAGSTYTWTGPNGYTSTSQNPVITNTTFSDSGYYRVVASSGSCNANPDSIRISINPVPATPQASYNNPVCTGSTLDLFATTVPGAVTYNWSGPNSYSVAQQNPTISGATTANNGTYSVYASLSGCKSSSSTVMVTISSVPPLTGVTSNGPVCLGGTLSLSAPPINGATYNWTGPNSFSDTAQSPLLANITASDSGDYLVVAHLSSCTSAPDTVHVAVNPLPVPVLTASPTTICSSDSSNVCVTQSYVSYEWNGIAGNTQCIYVNAAGNYYVTVTDANGCTAQSSQQNSVSISVFSVSSVSIIEKGDTLATFGGSGYQWFRNDTLIQGATQSIYIVPVTGEYSVALTDTNGCIASSSQVPVTITSVGINEVNAAFNFSVYPNPASGSFNIVYTGSADKNIQLNMYNILGQAVKQENLSFGNGKNRTVDISTLPKGVYLLQFMQQGGQLLTKKLVVQ